MCLKLLSLSVFASLILGVHCKKVTKRFTLRRQGYRVMDTSITEEHVCEGLQTCVSICSHLAWCLSASFNPIQKRCLLGRGEVTHEREAIKHLISRINWITLSKAEYKVFQHRHPDGGYKATYQDAVTLCKDMNTVVASEADLLESRALGMDFCACGWLSNQRNGMILQSPDPCSHGRGYHEGVIYCDLAKANAWCRL